MEMDLDYPGAHLLITMPHTLYTGEKFDVRVLETECRCARGVLASDLLDLLGVPSKSQHLYLELLDYHTHRRMWTWRDSIVTVLTEAGLVRLTALMTCMPRISESKRRRPRVAYMQFNILSSIAENDLL